MARSAENLLAMYEPSATLIQEFLTDTGDHTVFTGTAKVYSGKSGQEPDIRPDGIVSGMRLTAPTENNDEVTCAAFTCYLNGELKSVAAATITLDRPTATHAKYSLQYDGSALAFVKGTEGAAFADERGVEGSAPVIAAGSIEIAQIWISSSDAAVIDAAEIHESAPEGTQERFDYPVLSQISCLGMGKAAPDGSEKYAHVKFNKPLPTSHANNTTKGVHASVYAPDFTDVGDSKGWKSADVSGSASSTQIYRKTINSSSKSLGAAGITVYPDDPVNHPLRSLDGEVLTWKTFPDENREGYILTQGMTTIATEYPEADNVAMTLTIAATEKSVYFDA